jgi:Family of unknown function (DUF6580)
MKTQNVIRILLPYLLVLGVAILRLSAGHPYHFVPIFACLLFFGASRGRQELAIPFSALVGVDVFLTIRQGYGVDATQMVTWAWYLAAMMAGVRWLRGRVLAGSMTGFSLAAAISFFLVSNFTVWAEWAMYPKTLGGLGACYTAALPYFRNSFAGELAGSLLLFALSRYGAASSVLAKRGELTAEI